MPKLSNTLKSAIIAEDQKSRIADAVRKFRECAVANASNNAQTEPKHTQLPWTFTVRVVSERPVLIREHIALGAPGGPTFAYLPYGKDSRQGIQMANAELIYQAVHSHDQLVAALKAWEDWCYTGGDTKYATASRLTHAALAAAEGDHHEG